MRWNDGVYSRDDWKVLPNVTLNLGVRYEFVQPFLERHDRQASFYTTSALTPGHSTGPFILPKSQSNLALPQGFLICWPKIMCR